MASVRLPVDLLQTLLDESSDQLFVVEAATGRVIDCNMGACVALGYTREELLERTVADFDLTYTLKRRSELADAAAGGEVDTVAQYQRKNGEVFPVRV
ncbi:MAG: PAS domain S-box protein, partial [Dehalococcoidia bacterium]|nr:PAS domain S-box protein [Dehalococcoidia bacterium]